MKKEEAMRKWLLILLIVVIVIIASGLYFIMKGPDLSKYEYLKEPQITKMADQTMLVVEAVGDPNVAGQKAFSTLYQTYFKLKNNEKRMDIAPRARWPLPFDTPKDKWIGKYALPVSQTAELPDNFKQADANLRVRITTWKYGEVAEILHIGPYGTEPSTFAKLDQLVKARGYRITGEHEEEYIKGPGMFGPGNPKKYYTIIRYAVSK